MTTRDEQFATLNRAIADCRRCDGMNLEANQTSSAPGCGDRAAPVAIVGQSLCHRCMETGIPFTGGSERFVLAALAAAEKIKNNVFITNVVHCHPHSQPRDNRPSRDEEIRNCREYLWGELDLVAPRLVIGFGRDERAHNVFREKYPRVAPLEWWPGNLPLAPAGHPAVVFFPHPAWVAMQPALVRAEWVADLAAVIEWGFR